MVLFASQVILVVAGRGLCVCSCRRYASAVDCPFTSGRNLQERCRGNRGESLGTGTWALLVFTIAELIVPGFDHRWTWTPPQPVWRHLLGLVLVILGTLGLIWAMKANRFFSAFIRIQQERGHQVVDAGPYRFVRHPGYASWGLRTLGVPLLFGSNWAFIVAGLFVVMFIVRTILEDRVLQKELPGYREYAERVTWKIIKGIW